METNTNSDQTKIKFNRGNPESPSSKNNSNYYQNQRTNIQIVENPKVDKKETEKPADEEKGVAQERKRKSRLSTEMNHWIDPKTI